MKYMLDTNIIIYAKNQRSDRVIEKMMKHSPEDFCISAITLAELEYGIYKSARPRQNQVALMTFLSRIRVVQFDDKAAVEYGVIRADLERKGQPIGANDLLIAAHAKSLGVILITNNVREFARVGGLRVENWT